ncbi:hypothetical protein HID58_095247 [Brassica napus]|uniref:Replication factor A C-terminal domain-containing protein n=1 Tax=Brassica napus TaxID=3708 RepID=A0ABQ7X4B6_BRANA|nr:hypothetical protein HID58_095247 [Brassica napus]
MFLQPWAATLMLATVNVNRLATYMPYLKAGNQNFRLSYSSLLIRFSDANSLDEITEPLHPHLKKFQVTISDVSVTLSFSTHNLLSFTKLEADVVIHERLLQPAFIQKLSFVSQCHIMDTHLFQQETNVGERYLYNDTGHATAAPLLRGYAKVEPLTIAELNEFSDKNEEESSDIYFICIGMITGIKIDKGLCYVSCSNCTRKLQRTVSAFTCVHCNNTNAVGVLRYGVEMVIA